MPPGRVERARARLAVSERALRGLLRPASRDELLGAVHDGVRADDPLLRELAGHEPRRWLEVSPRYRAWRLARAALDRLRLAWRAGDARCLGQALETWWSLADLRSRE